MKIYSAADMSHMTKEDQGWHPNPIWSVVLSDWTFIMIYLCIFYFKVTLFYYLN